MRNLKWLGFRVPLAIVNKAHQANQLYPFAISLIESVRTYERTNEKVAGRQTVGLLVAGMQNEIHATVSEGLSLDSDGKVLLSLDIFENVHSSFEHDFYASFKKVGAVSNFTVHNRVLIIFHTKY